MNALVVLLLVAWSGTAQSTVIWDHSPDTLRGTYGGDWVNVSTIQNFASDIRFDRRVRVTGIDVYSLSDEPATVGTSVTIRISSNLHDHPGDLLYQFTETINVDDAEGATIFPSVSRKHADFSRSINLRSDTTYWIGMSGTSVELGQLALGDLSGPSLDGQIAQFRGSDYWFLAHLGEMAFRVHGCVIGGGQGPCRPVFAPEPGTLALLMFGLACMGFTLRNRKCAHFAEGHRAP